MSNKPEGAVFPFMVLIQAIEDGINDSVDTRHVDKADHRSSTPAGFHEAALNDIRGGLEQTLAF
ncbi:MAG: hypothetical protein ABSH01_13115 [Terriglobia bacterium]